MKYTVLEMVQSILSAMDSDEVNSITDTVESRQVSTLLKTLYYDIAVDLELPEHETLFELTASGDSAKPTLMFLPDNVASVHWIKYDNKGNSETYQNYKEVKPLSFNDFLSHVQGLRENTTGIGQMTVSMNGEDFEFIYQTDRAPKYYTQVDNYNIIFDAYDTTEDSTLNKAKTMCLGTVYPTFTESDTFTPDLDFTQFPYFLNRAKVRAFAELKQADNAEAAASARRQKIIIQKRQDRVDGLPPIDRAPNYGRK